MGSCNDNINSFWALDKFDKIGVSIILVFFAIFSVLSTFSFGFSNEVSFDYLGQFAVSGTDTTSVGSTVQLVSGTAYRLVSLPSYYGYTYNIKYNIPSTYGGDTYIRLISFDSSPSVGSCGTLVDYQTSSPGTTISFDYFLETSSPIYLLISVNGWGSEDILNNLTITTDFNGTGLQSAVQTLLFSFDLWSVFKMALPYVLVVVLVSFGFYLISHSLRELSKGRDI